MSQPDSTPQQPHDPYGDQPTAPYGQSPSSPPPGSGSYGGGSYPGGGSYGGGGGSYGGGGPYGGGSGPLGGQQSSKGFFGALFDLGFTTFVTPMIIKVVYIIGLVAIGIATVFFALSGFAGDSPALGIVTLLLSPVVGLLYLCFFRMMCEFYLAITRMSEDINRRLPQS